MNDLLEEVSSQFRIGEEQLACRQFQIQSVRASVTQEMLAHMADVELTDGWLFSILEREEEQSLRDPDDVYIDVRKREQQRIDQGLPPRIRFLDDDPATGSIDQDG